MNWYSGNIAEAVAESKSKGAIFVVFIEGQDEMSGNLQALVDNPQVYSRLESSDFVAIKIQGNSTAYGQFISLYKVVPVPSIFFIGKTGTPLEIATGIVSTAEELCTKIDRALVAAGKQPESMSTSPSDSSGISTGIVEQEHGQAQNNLVEKRNVAGADDNDNDENRQDDDSNLPKPKASMRKKKSVVVIAEPSEASPVATTAPPSSQNPEPTVPISQPVSATSMSIRQPVSVTSTVVEQPISATLMSTGQPISPTVQPLSEISTTTGPSVVTSPLSASSEDSAQLLIATSVATERKSEDEHAEAATLRSPAAVSLDQVTPDLEEEELLAADDMTTASTRSVVRQVASTARQLIRAVPLPTMTSAATATTPVPVETNQVLSDSELRANEVQNLLEERKRERQEEEQRRERENELRRRRDAQESQAPQSEASRRDQELRQVQERIRRERLAEQEARERIRAQIAADRAEQSRRQVLEAEMAAVNPLPTIVSENTSLSSVAETRLQIRLPGGIHRTKAFAIEEPLSTVRTYVRSELLAGSNIRDFTLATTYPRREFKLEEEVKTLADLNLVPNAVVLVVTQIHPPNALRATGGNFMSMLVTVVWAILTPAAKAFDYVHTMGYQRIRNRISEIFTNWGVKRPPVEPAFIPGNAIERRNWDTLMRPPGTTRPQQSASPPPPQEPPGAHFTERAQSQQPGGPRQQQSEDAPRPPVQLDQRRQQQAPTQAQQSFQPPASYRYGESNIRRLQDTKKDDEDKATYNGNSTQQQ